MAAAPNWASTAADSELDARPLPKLLVELATSVPLPEVRFFRLTVDWPPRVASFSWYEVPLWVVVSGTVPTKTPLPLPEAVCTCSWVERTWPVAASVTSSWLLGVPSARSPSTVVRYARRGLPSLAQTTSSALPVWCTAVRGDSSLSAATPTVACTAPVAWAAALSAGICGLRLGRAICAPVALSTEVVEPSAFWCTTRSPPRTGSPAKVRS